MNTENKKQLYEFTKDYPLAGRKKGEQVEYARVGTSLKNYVKLVGKASAQETGNEEVPDESNTKDELIAYLHSKGVSDATEKNTKDELLKAVKRVSKQK